LPYRRPRRRGGNRRRQHPVGDLQHGAGRVAREEGVGWLHFLLSYVVRPFPNTHLLESEMVAQREKTLSYRRAEWLNGQVGPNLEKCLRHAVGVLKTIEERTINRGGQKVRIAKADDASSGGLFLHLTTETPGEPASVVPKASPNAQTLDLTTERPPADGEWLDGDAYVYVNQDHVCLCTTIIRDGAISNFIKDLFQKATLPKGYNNFVLMKAADISKLKMLHSQGVKELELRAVLYEATALYEKRRARATGALGAIGKHFKAVLGKPHDVTPDSVRVALTIKVDRRFSKSLSLGEKNIEDLAADIVENAEAQDDYVVVTQTGQKISPHEIFIKSTVLIESDGKTVNREKAWRELSLFHTQLESAGVFEQ
jgi:hypothetical protein